VNSEKAARLELFAAIEGGSTFWTSEIASQGVIQTLHSIKDGFYRSSKGEKTLSQIHPGGADELLSLIDNAGGSFLTPEDLGCIASDFAAGFVDREWLIVSGGAYGIDTHAHKGALIAEGVTIAVIASGIDINYPAGNERLFSEIAELGAIVSEVMPGTPAFPSRFLTRNRIIAALSKSTLVVEAAFRSGSLRNARDAAELLRPVMAIPGPINSPTSEGTHRLIGERAAEIVTSVADAIELISSLEDSFR